MIRMTGKWIKFIGASLFILIMMVSCKSSDKYAGECNGVRGDGVKVMINFSKDKELSFVDEDGNEDVYEMNQTATGIQNSTRYFRVEIDEKDYYVVFEDTDDEDNAQLIRQTNHADDFEDVVGDIIYIMNRNDYPSP